MRDVLIIANPIAGGGHARDGAAALSRALTERGFQVDLRLTTGAADVVSFAADADPERFGTVVSVGGDGTLNSILNHLPDPSLPLAMMPFGTANVLAHELRLPRRPDEIAALIAEHHTIEVAIGLAHSSGEEGRKPQRFLLFAGAGLDGAMVEQLERTRKGRLGKLRWFPPALTIARHLPRDRIRVETDDGTVHEDLGEVLITRVRNYGGVFSMPGDIDIRDGLLHVICFRQRTRWQWFRAAFRAWIGRLRPGRDVDLLAARSVRIGGLAPVPYHIDGDFGGRTPLTVDLDARRARLVVPRGL